MPISREENAIHKALLKSQNEIKSDISKINKKIKCHYKKHGVHGDGFLDDLKSVGNTIKSGFEDKIEHPLENIGNQIKTGFEDKIINPVQNQIISPTQNLINSLPDKTKKLFDSVPESMKNDPKFQKALDYVTKKKGGLATSLLHNGLPSLTSALGGAAGTILAPELGMFGGIAGSTAGGYAGKELADYIGNKTGTGLKRRGRPRKHHIHHSWEAEDVKPKDSALGQLIKAHRLAEEKELQKGQLDITRHLHEEMMALRRGQELNKVNMKKLTGGAIHSDTDSVSSDDDVTPRRKDFNKNSSSKKSGMGISNVSGRNFKKGSKEAKKHMAKIRAMKGMGTGPVHYGSAWSAHNAQLYGNGGKGLYP
jgi:hypothetical protein